MQGKTPARLYALVVGATLVLAGFFYEAEFTSDESVSASASGSS